MQTFSKDSWSPGHDIYSLPVICAAYYRRLLVERWVNADPAIFGAVSQEALQKWVPRQLEQR